MLKNISFLRPGAQSADTLAEEQYQKMLSVLWDQKMEKESDAAIARQESVDYYSLWAHQIKTPLAAMRLLLQEEGQEHGSDSFSKGNGQRALSHRTICGDGHDLCAYRGYFQRSCATVVFSG